MSSHVGGGLGIVNWLSLRPFFRIIFNVSEINPSQTNKKLSEKIGTGRPRAHHINT